MIRPRTAAPQCRSIITENVFASLEERPVQNSRWSWIAWALVALALAVGVVACGGDDEPAQQGGGTEAGSLEGETVRLWIMPNGPDPKNDIDGLLAPFTEKTGIKVETEVVGWDVMQDRIRNAAVSGEGPDITQAGTTQVPFFAALGGFEDLSGRVEDIGGAAAYPDGVWATTQLAGQDGTYAVPWFTEARAIYYRKDVLEQAGVDPATAFQDWDSMQSTLQAVKDKVPAVDGQPIQPFGSPGKKAYDLVHHVMPFVWDAGGAELSPDNTQSTIDTPQAAQGVEFMAGLLQKGLYDKAQLQRDGTQVENQFKGGRIAVWIGGPWTYASSARGDDENWVPAARKNVGIAPMPSAPGGDAYTFVGGSNLMMFKSAENKDAAWEVMKYMSSDDFQTKYAELLGMFPSRTEPQKAIADKDPNYESWYDAIQQGRTYAPIAQWAQIENAYKARFGNILDAAGGLGGGSYSEAKVNEELQAAADEADALLAQGTS
jgi:multiple sugar transport system substrate-binding protein